MTRHSLASLLATTAIFTTPAYAQDAAFDLGTIFVESSSLTPVEQTRSGANVEVLQGADTGANDSLVLDRLARLPGVNQTSNGGIGALGTLQVRGLPARYVGVRINGIDVSDPSGTQNQFNFGGLTAAGIERAELLKGSQSAVFGSEAIAGVVNLTTFRPSELGFSGHASLEAGSFGTYSGPLSFGQRTEQGFVAFTFGRITSDGISSQSFNTEEDSFEQTTVHLSGEHAFSDTFSVGGAVFYRDSDTEIDRSSFSNDATGEIAARETGARVFARLETGAVTHELSYSYFDIDRKDPGGFTTRFQGERETLAYLGTASLNSATTLNFGIEHTQEDLTSGSTAGGEDNTSLTAEVLYSPTDRFDLSAALRHDDNSSFGGETTGRLTAVFRPQFDLALRASVGTGYRAPSLFERFSAFGEPNLQPESSVGYELGVEKTYGEQGFVKTGA